MAIRQLRFEGDAILKKVAKHVKEITPNIITLLEDMRETLHEKNGVGIAAPQIGVLKRIVVIEYEDVFYELINPEIVETEGTQVSNEACLSVLGLCGDVERPAKMTVKALDRNYEPFTVVIEDFLASVFGHELDHLDGILFLDKATNLQQITQDQLEQRRAERKKRFKN